jgi:hypothetical protein
MSEEDIEKGSRGLEEIGKALEAMSVGIICLTPENLEKPWILFEAGALSKTLGDKTRVCPYLLGDFRGEGLRLPLGMFQATRADKKETRKLLGTVNRALGSYVGEDGVDTWFEREWPGLKGKLDAVPAADVAAPPRDEKKMVAEILDLARSGANNSVQTVDALRVVVGGVQDVLTQIRAAQGGALFRALGGNIAPVPLSSLVDSGLYATRVASGGPGIGNRGTETVEEAARKAAALQGLAGLYGKGEMSVKKEGEGEQVPRHAHAPHLARKGRDEKKEGES